MDWLFRYLVGLLQWEKVTGCVRVFREALRHQCDAPGDFACAEQLHDEVPNPFFIECRSMSCNEQQVRATTFLRSKPFRVGLLPL